MHRIGVGVQGTDVPVEEFAWLAPQCLVALHHDVGTYINLLYRDAINKDCIIIIRFYHDDVMAWQAEDWANYCVDEWHDAAAAVQSFGVNPYTHLQLQYANELNLAVEHKYDGRGQSYWESLQGYEEMTSWAERVVNQIRSRDSHIILHSDPLAPGHNPPGFPPGWEHNYRRFLYDACDVISAHVYWRQNGADIDSIWYGRRPLRTGTEYDGIFAMYPTKKKFISEYNEPNCAYGGEAFANRVIQWNNYYRDVPNLLGTALFLYNTFPGSGHEALAITGTPAVGALVELRGGVGPAPPPPPPPIMTNAEVDCIRADPHGASIISVFEGWGWDAETYDDIRRIFAEWSTFDDFIEEFETLDNYLRVRGCRAEAPPAPGVNPLYYMIPGAAFLGMLMTKRKKL